MLNRLVYLAVCFGSLKCVCSCEEALWGKGDGAMISQPVEKRVELPTAATEVKAERSRDVLVK